MSTEKPQAAPATQATQVASGSNQSEGEFFAMVVTGRKGLDTIADSMGSRIMAIAAPNVQATFSTWMQRAIVSIGNDDNLKDIINSRTGLFSVYQGLAKASTMGLQIGGQFPHAYFVPKGGKVVLMPSAQGLAYVAAHGPGAVLRYIPLVTPIYEHDKFSVDNAAGTYKHIVEPLSDRGKLVAWYAKLEYIDGRVEIPFVLQSEVVAIENNYGNTNSPAYKKSIMDMHAKTAAKKLLKRPAAEAEGLAMAMSADDEAIAPDEPAERPSANVSERMGARLDKVATKIAPAASPENTKAAEPVPPETVEDGVFVQDGPAPEGQPEGQAPESDSSDLF